jgi:preprotein translocase subunit SecF
MPWPLIKPAAAQVPLPFRALRPLRRRPVGPADRRLLVGLLLPGPEPGHRLPGRRPLEVPSRPARSIALRESAHRAGPADGRRRQVQGFGAGTQHERRLHRHAALPVPEGENARRRRPRLRDRLSPPPAGQFKLFGSQRRRPKVSGELLKSGFMALGVAMLLMFGYIWFRFEPQFGFGAVVACSRHDPDLRPDRRCCSSSSA